MTLETKVFGEVTIEEDKIITFPGGIIGFPDLTQFALLHDEEDGLLRFIGCSRCRSRDLPCRLWTP